MKPLLSVLFICCAFSITNSQDLSQNTLIQQNFSINWVDTPQYSIDTIPLEDFGVVSEYWILEMEDESHPNWKYVISKDQYPSDYIHSDSAKSTIEELINSTQYELLDDNSLELQSSIEIENSGYYGKEFRWKDNLNNIYFRHQVYIIENSIFQLSVYSREGTNHNTDINKFFDSFQLNPSLRGNYSGNSDNYIQSYTIKFPQTPSLMSKVVDTEVGKLTMYINIFEPENDSNNFAYMVSEARYPPNTINATNKYELNSFYAKAINGSLNSTEGEIITVKDIELAGFSGKEYKCYILNGASIATYRVFLINQNLYILGVFAQIDKDENAEMKNFLDSFKFK